MKADLVRGAQILSVAVYDGTNFWLITPNDEVMNFSCTSFDKPCHILPNLWFALLWLDGLLVFLLHTVRRKRRKKAGSKPMFRILLDLKNDLAGHKNKATSAYF